MKVTTLLIFFMVHSCSPVIPYAFPNKGFVTPQESESIMRFLSVLINTEFSGCRCLVVYKDDDEELSSLGYYIGYINRPVVIVRDSFNNKTKMNDYSHGIKLHNCAGHIIFIASSKKVIDFFNIALFLKFSDQQNKFLVFTNASDVLLDSIFTTFHSTLLVTTDTFHVYKRDEFSTNILTINQWDGNCFVKDTPLLFSDKTKNLNGKNLKIVTFNLPPTTLTENDNKESHDIKYGGIEPGLVFILGEAMNFTYHFQAPSDGGLWGSLWDDMVTGKADVGIANFYIGTDTISYASFPYDSDCLTFLTPAPKLSLPWYSILRSFHWTVWIVTMVMFLVSVATACIIRILQCKIINIKEPKLDLIVKIILEHVSVFLGVSLHKRSSIQSVYICWVFFSFLLMSAYLSKLIAHLTTPFGPPPIDTIKELATSDLIPVSPHLDPIFQEAFRSSPNKYMSTIFDTFIEDPDRDKLLRGVSEGKYAYMGGKAFSQYTKSKLLSKEQKLHVMNICLILCQVSILFQPQNISRSAVDSNIIKILASGLYSKMKWDVIHPKLPYMRYPDIVDEAVPSPLSVVNVKAAFILLGCGLLGSSILFLWEFLLKKTKIANNIYYLNKRRVIRLNTLKVQRISVTAGNRDIKML